MKPSTAYSPGLGLVNNLGQKARGRRGRLGKNLFSVSVTTSDTRLIGSNPERVALLIVPTPDNINSVVANSKLANAVSTAAAGVKLSYLVPAGAQDLLLSASFGPSSVAGVVAALQVVRGGNTTELFRGTTSGQFTGNFALSAGDTIQWNVLTPQAASTTDFAIGLNESATSDRITISFGTQPAVLDASVNLHPGNPPLLLDIDDFG